MARVYLPQEDLEKFGVTAAELGAGEPMEKLRPLLEFEAAGHGISMFPPSG